MASIAQSAVLVSSAGAIEAMAGLPQVAGPSGSFHKAESVLAHYPTLGFQASHYAQACSIATRMLQAQAPSKVFAVVDGAFVEIASAASTHEDGAQGEEEAAQTVHPTLFLGVTANLLGTGCRSAIRFLVKEGILRRQKEEETEEQGAAAAAAIPTRSPQCSEMQALHRKWSGDAAEGDGMMAHQSPPQYRSFIGAIVVSGGAMEHDLRRTLGETDYAIGLYCSERRLQESASAERCHFGNVSYAGEPQKVPQGDALPSLLQSFMGIFVDRLIKRQKELRLAAEEAPARDEYSDVCTWAITPSEVWALAGLWLVDVLAEALMTPHKSSQGNSSAAVSDRAHAEEVARRMAETTVLYWAAKQEVPVFSPSFVDGDIMSFILSHGNLQVDLVQDIHVINKLAMLSKKTGMLICGGGVVKHHVCNANLMRNGADYTIVLNNGQEFDGSDGGAKPEEAISWGKIRIDGEAVKVYGEISSTLPLLVAQVFVPAVRARDAAERSGHEG